MSEISSFSAHFQPQRPLIDQLKAALSNLDWDRLDAPVAYAVTGGVQLLEERLRADPKWPDLRKRFLVGIDWCRSDPLALDAIAALPASSLRIVDGEQIVEVAGCRPSRSYHPKAFIFTRNWPSTNGVIGCLVGSGNLSRNGLTFGRELDVWANSDPSASNNSELRDSLSDIYEWFEDLWSASTPYESIRDGYRMRFEANQRSERRSTTEDDAVPIAIVRQRGLKAEDLVVVRSFDHLWVDAGSMYSNLGRGRSGNQLDLKRYSRVFFGFPARDLPRNSAIGAIDITYAGVVHPDRHLRYGDNQMDKLDLPVPGSDAPADYRYSTLLFRRFVDANGRVRFDLEIAGTGDRQEWWVRSKRAGGLFKFGGASDREFGVY